ncbi:MAG: 4Fe-4S dicluster domain-containing protein [Geminicoccaceae bacterium]
MPSLEGRIAILDGPRSPRLGALDVDRRRALGLLAAGMAGTLGGCSPPDEEIVPYVKMPERLVPGVEMRFATTLPLAGYGRGVIAISREGRPIKVEGNPRHPASLGATDVFAEASVLDLYDPQRAQVVRQKSQISSWEAFETALVPRLAELDKNGGTGLRLLTDRITSPTLLAQIDALKRRFPAARWHRYEAVSDDAERAGARLAYGRTLEMLPDLAAADVVLSIDADPLGVGPHQIANGRAFSRRRTVRRSGLAGAGMARMYAAESVPRLTGASGDHRIALSPAILTRLVLRVAAALGAPVARPELPADADAFADAVARDLAANPGRALVLIGSTQPLEIHALGHWNNAQLKAPARFIEPVDPVAEDHADSLAALVADMTAGRVETLLTLGCNPAYTTPADLDFAAALARVPFRIGAGLRYDETASRCEWFLPLSHALESWSDLRSVDGTASIVQPLILPLYATRTAHEVVGLFTGLPVPSSYDLVRSTWRSERAADQFEDWWRDVLVQGVIPDTAAPAADIGTPLLPPLPEPPRPADLSLVFQADPTVWDGSYTPNAWLQECPKPLTKQVWGNALLMAPEEAAARGVHAGGGLTLNVGGREVAGPVLPLPGMARGVVALSLGYGRREAGQIGNGLGIDAYAIRRGTSPWVETDLECRPIEAATQVIRLQHEFEVHGREEIVRLVDLAALAAEPTSIEPPPRSFYPQMSYDERPYPENAWAMVIDATLCIGCNACVVACQAENNVPVVGPTEVARGRDMHWLRIDTYLPQEAPSLRFFQPVPCMHCEQAPCEPVCPVEASVHDHQGLNVQVYNRCIGTRFCQANCPYKVRRFNFFAYANGQEYADLGAESVQAQRNPEVTVRSRGVMEKCTYCVQRISRAKIAADREGRAIAEGEVVTACAAACPTRAIRFGDLASADGEVATLRREPQHYALLGHLGTQPRTTYLARLRNPNPALHEGEDET